MVLMLSHRAEGEFCIGEIGDPDICQLDWFQVIYTFTAMLLSWVMILFCFTLIVMAMKYLLKLLFSNKEN